MNLLSKIAAVAASVSVLLTGTSCELIMLPTDDSDSSIVTQTGTPVLTGQAVMVAVYASLKKDASLSDDFLSVASWMETISADKALSPEELRAGVTNVVMSSPSKKKDLILLSFAAVFNYYECVYPNQALNLFEYNSLINAVVQGIFDAVSLYDALKEE